MNGNDQPNDEPSDLTRNRAIDAIALVAFGLIVIKYGPLLMQQGVAENLGAAFYMLAADRIYTMLKRIRTRQ